MQLSQFALAGPGQGIDVKTVYNSFGNNTFNDNGNLGAWSTNVGLLGLDIQASQVVFHGESGEIATFSGTGPTYTSPPGVNATLTKNAGNNTYTLTYNRTGEIITFAGNTGRATSSTDRNGVGVTYSYTTGNYYLNSVTDSVGKSVGFRIEIRPMTGRVMDMSDSSGRHVYPDWDGGMSFSGYRGTIATTYNTDGRLASIARDGKTITFEYTNGQVTKVTQSKTGEADVVTSLAHSAGQTVVTDPRGNTSTYAIDAQFRVTSVTDQLGHARTQTWTPNSDVATVTDATAGNVTTNSYDSNSNLTQTKLPTGAAAQAFYAAGTNCPNAASGNPYSAKCTVDSAGNKSSIEYDTAGNPLKQTDTSAGGGTITHRYTYETAAGTVCGGKAGQICTSKDGNGNTTSYAYTNGNLTTVTPPAPLGATTYAYDSLGRVTSVTDGNGATTTYGYDTRDRITTTTYADNSTVLTAWATDSTKTSESDSASSLVIKYTYNLLNKITQQKFETTNSSLLADTVNMTYDKNGNLTTYADAGGTVTYAYDAANRFVKLKEPGGTCPTGTAGPTAGSGCTLFQYDNNNAETARIFPGGARVDTTVDNSGRPTRITAKDATGSVINDIGYSYTAPGGSGQSGDRSAIQTRTSYNERGITAGAVTTYSYDTLRRLTKAEEKSGSTITASWAYGYDAAGNRTSQVTSGSSITAGNVTYAYNAANELASTNTDTTTWTYDAAGNQTKNGITGTTATYGVKLNVTAIGGQSYSSFAQGNAQGLTVAGSTKLLTSALGITRATAPSANQQYYTRTPDGQAFGYRNTASQTRAYFVEDHLGSVAAVFDTNGATTVRYSYTPYGELRSQSSSTAETDNDLRYTGGFKVGNYYKFGARYYDPTIGRFTQFDPSGQESNPYVYAGCNPVNAKDPSGLDCAEFATGVAIDVVGFMELGVDAFTTALGAVPTGGLDVIAGAALAEGIAAEIAVGTYLAADGAEDCFG